MKNTGEKIIEKITKQVAESSAQSYDWGFYTAMKVIRKMIKQKKTKKDIATQIKVMLSMLEDHNKEF